MDPTTQQWRFREGDEVVGADDAKLGKVVAVLPDAARPAHLRVEKGVLFHTEYYVPVAAVAHYDGGKVYLSVTKDDALHQAWDAVPAAAMEASGEPPAATTGAGGVARGEAGEGPGDARLGGSAGGGGRAPGPPGGLARPGGGDRGADGDVDAAHVDGPGG
jgi:hypothetical protein